MIQMIHKNNILIKLIKSLTKALETDKKKTVKKTILKSCPINYFQDSEPEG